MYGRPLGGNPATHNIASPPRTRRLMARIVQKFGGTSVADIARIKSAAQRVKREVDAGSEVAVVASGEQVTAGLLALALQDIGVNARSWLGWQMPLRTDGVHGKARIQEIPTDDLIRRMGEGQVAIVAGFQGVGPDNRITTLGRGGSDASAVALAAALRADRCDIFTDVDGVYTTDPRIVAKARKLDRITYEEMLEFASQGSKVLQTRSVELAMNHHVRVQVLSSFAAAVGSDLPGTMVMDEEEIMAQGLEKSVVSGIAFS